MVSVLPYVLLLAGFVLLIKGADFLVNVVSSIARRFHVSELVIGLTIMAFGTSTPELFGNIFASNKGSTDISIGKWLAPTF
jgi:cation:H+ antiporter